MTSGEVMRWLLIGASGLLIGVVVYTVIVHLARLVAWKPRTNKRRAVGFVLSRAGFAITTYLVLVRILFPSPEIPLSKDSVEYAAGLLIGAIGFWLVARTDEEVSDG